MTECGALGARGMTAGCPAPRIVLLCRFVDCDKYIVDGRYGCFRKMGDTRRMVENRGKLKNYVHAAA